jgi:hypothetical protein
MFALAATAWGMQAHIALCIRLGCVTDGTVLMMVLR